MSEYSHPLWGTLQGGRSDVLDFARACSRLTIPGLIPENDGASFVHETPYQSLGARGVNHLAAKLLLTTAPPDTPFFRFRIPEETLSGLGDRKGAVEQRLASMERAAINRVETAGARPVQAEAWRHLVIAGNVLYYFPEKGSERIFRLDQYLLERDASGNPIKGIVRERVAVGTLPETARALVTRPEGIDEDKWFATPTTVWTPIYWGDGKVKWWQEIEGKKVPGTEGEIAEEKSPWLPLVWTRLPNENYGRSFIMEYFGDLYSLEELTRSVIAYTAAAAKLVFLRSPNASMQAEDFKNAETGDIIDADIDDLRAFVMDKQQDFSVTLTMIEKLELRLSQAFMLVGGTIRDAERVTAEEIRAIAQELEDTLGGTYTVLAQSFQLPYVRRLIHVMQKEGSMVRLPDGIVEPQIVTGFQALGRNHSVNRIRAFLTDARNMLGDQVLAYINIPNTLTELGTGHGVERLAELVKSAEQVAQDQQQAVQTEAALSAVGPAIQAASRQQG
jgi:hypothetical protein